MCYTQRGGEKQQWCKQTRTWTLKLVEERVGYLGRCHSHAWFEPWLQRCALAPSTRPAAVMQLPCIKSSLPCNLQTENEASHVVSWLEATIGSFYLSNNSFISPEKKGLKMTTDTETRGGRDWNNLRMLHTNIHSEFLAREHFESPPLVSHRCVFIPHLWTLDVPFAPACSPSMDTLWARTKELFSEERSQHEGKVNFISHREGWFVNAHLEEERWRKCHTHSFETLWPQTLFTKKRLTLDLLQSIIDFESVI